MAEFDVKKAVALEQKYDSGLHLRAVGPWLVKFTFLFSVLFAAGGPQLFLFVLLLASVWNHSSLVTD